MHPKMWFACWHAACWARCCVTLSLLSPAPPAPFLQGCSPATPLPAHPLSSIAQSQVQNPAFTLAQFHVVMIARCSSLSRCLPSLKRVSFCFCWSAAETVQLCRPVQPGAGTFPSSPGAVWRTTRGDLLSISPAFLCCYPGSSSERCSLLSSFLLWYHKLSCFSVCSRATLILWRSSL